MAGSPVNVAMGCIVCGGAVASIAAPRITQPLPSSYATTRKTPLQPGPAPTPVPNIPTHSVLNSARCTPEPQPAPIDACLVGGSSGAGAHSLCLNNPNVCRASAQGRGKQGGLRGGAAPPTGCEPIVYGRVDLTAEEIKMCDIACPWQRFRYTTTIH